MEAAMLRLADLAVSNDDAASLAGILARFPRLVSAADEAGQTLLHNAALGGRALCVALLLQLGAPLEAADSAGRTPMVAAAGQGQAACLRLLVNAITKVPAPGTNGGNDSAGSSSGTGTGSNSSSSHHRSSTPSALVAAAKAGSLASVRLLLDAGSEIDAADGVGTRPLHAAAAAGCAACLRLLLDKGADVEAMDGLGRSALKHAAAAGREKCLRLLLEAGAAAHTAEGGASAVELAAEAGYEGCVHALLNARSAVSAGLGAALCKAVAAGHHTCVSALVAAGADVELPVAGLPTIQLGGGTRLLMLAAQRGHAACIRVLLEAGADVEAADDSGRTALLHAALCQEEAGVGGPRAVACVQALLAGGASPTAADSQGRTALHWLACRGSSRFSLAAAGCLLEAGGDLAARDAAGLTPLQAAIAEGNRTMAGLLLELLRQQQTRKEVQRAAAELVEFLTDLGRVVKVIENAWMQLSTAEQAQLSLPNPAGPCTIPHSQRH